MAGAGAVSWAVRAVSVGAWILWGMGCTGDDASPFEDAARPAQDGGDAGVQGDGAVLEDAALDATDRDATAMDASERDAAIDRGDASVASLASGSALAIQGHRLVVGSEQVVRVYALTGCSWALEAELEGDDASFGVAVAISGETLVVGASNEQGDDLEDAGAPEPGVGAAYVFERTGGAWSLRQKLVPGVALPGGAFGSSVGVYEHTAVVGSLFGSHAYVFEREGEAWLETARLGGDADSTWGEAIAVGEDTIVVSSSSHGAVAVTQLHVFERAGQAWSESVVLMPESLAARDWGVQASLDGDTFAVGVTPSFLAASMFADAYVHVYRREGGAWAQEQQVAAGSGRVALLGSRLLVGAPLEADAFIRQGVVRLYERERGQWQERAELVSEAPMLNAGFGGAVALNDSCAAVTDTGSQGGAPELFELSAISMP